MSILTEMRAQKDEFFARDLESPLSHQQKRTFLGLVYFPENPSLRLELPIEIYPVQEEIPIQTSTGDIRYFMRFGQIEFSLEDQLVSLTIFRNEFGYFLPFVDSLAGTETYPAGRYLEPEELGNGKYLIDFNYAYNPYCAYSEKYSCPLTPVENRLKIPIRAGEKIFSH